MSDFIFVALKYNLLMTLICNVQSHNFMIFENYDKSIIYILHRFPDAPGRQSDAKDLVVVAHARTEKIVRSHTLDQ